MSIWMTLSINCYKFHFPLYSLWYRFLYNLTSPCSIEYPLSLHFFVVYYRILKLLTPSTPLASLSTYSTAIITQFLHPCSAFVFLLSPKISSILRLLSHLLFVINGGVKMYKGDRGSGGKRDYFRWKENPETKAVVIPPRPLVISIIPVTWWFSSLRI